MTTKISDFGSGPCWVTDMATECAEKAIVGPDAQVFGDAKVLDQNLLQPFLYNLKMTEEGLLTQQRAKRIFGL